LIVEVAEKAQFYQAATVDVVSSTPLQRQTGASALDRCPFRLRDGNLAVAASNPRTPIAIVAEIADPDTKTGENRREAQSAACCVACGTEV
jgi:hypothetical protein